MRDTVKIAAAVIFLALSGCSASSNDGDSGLPDVDALEDVAADIVPFDLEIINDANQPDAFQEIVCVPDCTGLVCGPDPICGTSCGTCGDGLACHSGTCWSPLENGMVRVPSGVFTMGCNSELDNKCRENELPAHEVFVSDFFIDRSEVTVARYRECVDAGSCTAPDQPSASCTWGREGFDDHPMTCVDWYQAVDYCRFMGKRLPTEAEWEKAARGTDNRVYPWGNDPPTCDRAVIFEFESGRGCGTGETMPVCSKSPAGDSPYGACDMLGNVWERVSDWYSETYYAVSPADDPTGPLHGPGRVSRGGTITYYKRDTYLRNSARNYHIPSSVDCFIETSACKAAHFLL